MVEICYENTLTAQDYNELRESVGWNAITEKQASRGIEHTTFIVAAKDGDKIVGMGRALFDFGYTAYIGDVIVMPQYQGYGIGKKIVELLLEKVEAAADSGDMIMYMLGAAKGKEVFYEKLGFKTRPTDRKGAGMTKMIIAK